MNCSGKLNTLRKVADDLIYPEEKLVKLIEAEQNEVESNLILIKVLYAYLTSSDYDVVVKTGQPESPVTETKKEELPEAEKDSIVQTKKDTANSILPEVLKPAETSAIDGNISEKAVSEKKDTSIMLQPVSVIAMKDSVPVKKTGQIIEEPKKVESETIKELPENVPVKNISTEKDTGSLYGMVDINEDQIDKFNKFLQTSYPQDYENYIIDFTKLNYRDVDSLKAAWYKYLYPGNEEATPIIAEKQPGEDTLQIAVNNTTVKSSETIGSKSGEKKSTTTGSGKKGKDKTVSKVKPVKETEQFNYNDPATGFTFKVQIAACRIQMDPNSLQNMYSGELQIQELQEDKWFKYAIGEYNTYKQARQLRDKLNVPGAFVIAYLNGKRIKILSSMTGNKAETPSTLYTSDISGLTFKVQIAASKVILPKNI
ncbi:MAG: hypothetical protein HC830_04100 [Bacteroidetes bacterium]|nr:hypothetical protein [Bacteroidota bacterium]